MINQQSAAKEKKKNQIFHFSQNTDGPELLYLQVYHHYRNLITARKLLPGSRMPSLRKCSQELQLSRTTVENAYLQLAAEGYIISKAQSGYYVTDIATKEPLPRQTEKPSLPPCRYDLSSSGFSLTESLRGKQIFVRLFPTMFTRNGILPVHLMIL